MRLMAGRSRAVSVCWSTFTAPHCRGQGGPISRARLQFKRRREIKDTKVLRKKEVVGYRRMRRRCHLADDRRSSVETCMGPGSRTPITPDRIRTSAPHPPVPDIICATRATGIAACQLSMAARNMSTCPLDTLCYTHHLFWNLIR